MYVFVAVAPSTEGNLYELHTPDDGSRHVYDYNVLTTRDDVLTFSVQACNDAHVLIQSVPGSIDAKCFEIVLGCCENTQSQLREGFWVSLVSINLPVLVTNSDNF